MCLHVLHIGTEKLRKMHSNILSSICISEVHIFLLHFTPLTPVSSLKIPLGSKLTKPEELNQARSNCGSF